MTEKKKPLAYLIYDDLVNAVKGIGEKTFLGRPEPVGTNVANFIVVDILTTITGRVKGKFGVMTDCYGGFSIFCKAKSDRTLNIGQQSELTQKVLDLFPINGKYVVATKPRLLMRGSEDTGFYQVTQITFKIRTKFNI